MATTKELNAGELLELIFAYLTDISSLRDFDEILEQLANMGRALSGADRCTVWVVDEKKKTIWTKVAHEIDHIELPYGSGIVGHAIATGEKLIINDAYSDPRFNPEVDRATGYKTKSIMVIPMFDNNNTIIGAFQAINHLGSRSTFDQRDMQRLMLASTYAAETLISAQLTQEIQDTQKEVVFTMGAIGESRSKETGNHVKRVAEYSKILALALGMDEDEAELLKEASPMHDIGKVAIPDEILKKPGHFTKSERAIMQRHAQIGYEMIRHSERPLLKAAAIVAHEHHEKWDGSGYPRGLKEEEIHIYGRITALADVFDALGSDRVYKKAWPLEKIYKLIKEERGKHFDPKLVDLFFEHKEEILKVRERFKDVFDEKEEERSQKFSIEVLGAYGARLKGFGTSSFLLNDKNVIDAGNLIDTLEEFSANLDTIWLTHSHLDHISDIAYILDNYYTELKKPIRIAALKETIDELKRNFFNNSIWPDFSKIPLVNGKSNCIEYMPIEIGKRYSIGEDEYIEAIATDHTVASCGYIYTKEKRSILITSDTYDISNIIDRINSDKSIKAAVIECSFPSYLEGLAKMSKHLTPQLLFDALKKNFRRDDVLLYINHIKPVYLNEMIEEIEQKGGEFSPKIVTDKKILHF
ncbi:RESPONSE REGULATOR PROTEIN-CheY-like nd an HD-GYP domain [hydrothermal vent metagenome]|uniref:RESPONSE REGULATOR PROTEIN-CheY-like nd an HD-GYP domain n=1 Tax=hydrothermal vent metagenome TaxID=652676 RepID=A0A1W1BKL5_9ZZZZ